MPAEGEAALVVVGRIGAPHGVAGAVRVTSFTQPPDNLLDYAPWLVRGAQGFVAMARESARWQGKNLVVHLAGVNDRDAALALRGRDIAVPRSALPALTPGEEYYWQDLIGMTVVDSERGPLGDVRDLLETGANDVLVVGEGELLIPFVSAFVTDVDVAARIIRVTWLDPA